jgi:hypothetical protein
MPSKNPKRNAPHSTSCATSPLEKQTKETEMQIFDKRKTGWIRREWPT